MKKKFFSIAVKLACKSRPSPNPKVGAIVVKNGRILGTGYHAKAGDRHAEIGALDEAGSRAQGAELIVTLEPCHLYGKTPPCVEAIASAGIKKVYVGTVDPNPQEMGKGIERLKELGIEVELQSGSIKQMCQEIIREWHKFILSSVPFVRLKAAISIDGKIATHSGSSKWISSMSSRKIVHIMRAYHDALLVGIGTVVRDDPSLTVRYFKWEGPPPLRIVVDSKLKISHSSKIVQTGKTFPTLIAHAEGSRAKCRKLEKMGVQTLKCKKKKGKVDLADLVERLGRQSITSVLVEGGSKIFTSMIEEKIADAVTLFISPILIGGKCSLSLFTGKEISTIDEAVKLKKIRYRKVLSDIMLEGFFR